MPDSRVRTDRELIRAAQAGTKSALEAIYERYLPFVWRYVYTRLRGDRHAAEDVVSETFLAAVAALCGGKVHADGRPFYPWLIGVARHKLADHGRRAARGSAVQGPAEAEYARRRQPTGGSQEAERAARVMAAMAELPDEQRLMLEWKYLGELSVREIAGRLGRTEKAVESVLYRARNAFREALERPHGNRSDDR